MKEITFLISPYLPIWCAKIIKVFQVHCSQHTKHFSVIITVNLNSTNIFSSRASNNCTLGTHNSPTSKAFNQHASSFLGVVQFHSLTINNNLHERSNRRIYDYLRQKYPRIFVQHPVFSRTELSGLIATVSCPSVTIMDFLETSSCLS